jgi:hypothetical protein
MQGLVVELCHRSEKGVKGCPTQKMKRLSLVM